MSEEPVLPMWKCWRIFDCCIRAAHYKHKNEMCFANKDGWISIRLESFKEDFGLNRNIVNQLFRDKIKFNQLEHTCFIKFPNIRQKFEAKTIDINISIQYKSYIPEIWTVEGNINDNTIIDNIQPYRTNNTTNTTDTIEPDTTITTTNTKQPYNTIDTIQPYNTITTTTTTTTDTTQPYNTITSTDKMIPTESSSICVASSKQNKSAALIRSRWTESLTKLHSRKETLDKESNHEVTRKYKTDRLQNFCRQSLLPVLTDMVNTIVQSLDFTIVDRKSYLPDILELLKTYVGDILEAGGMDGSLFQYKGTDTAIVDAIADFLAPLGSKGTRTKENQHAVKTVLTAKSGAKIKGELTQKEINDRLHIKWNKSWGKASQYAIELAACGNNIEEQRKVIEKITTITPTTIGITNIHLPSPYISS